MTPRLYRVSTPARDFLEARGWSFGPWRCDRISARVVLSGLERRAREAANYAWKRLGQDAYRARLKAERYQSNASASAIPTSVAPSTADHRSPEAKPLATTFAPQAANPATNSHLPAQATAD